MLNNRENSNAVIAHINLRSVSGLHTHRIKKPPRSRLQKWDMKECSVVLSILRHILCGKSSQSTQRTPASSFSLLPHSLLYTITQEVLRRTLKIYSMSRSLHWYNGDYCATTYIATNNCGTPTRTFTCIWHTNLPCSILTDWLCAGFTGF